MINRYLKMILQAPVYDVATITDLDYASGLSTRLENSVWLKREDTQPVFSYKIRGAYTLMFSLGNKIKNGVIAASAGNHAQGVAISAKALEVPATIVMPVTTPNIKIEAVKKLGASVILHGNSYDDADDYVNNLVDEQGLIKIPPYDHEQIIAGQGTVGMEILRQMRGKPDIIFVPVGGGGLIAGVAAYVKAISPSTKVIGVEPEEAASMKQALEFGKPVRLEKVGIFSDGAAVKRVGNLTFEVVKEHVDSILTVSIDEICAAIKDVFEDTRTILEPAGALSLAGLKQYVGDSNPKGLNLVAICSGSNINFDRLRHVAELAELGERREVLVGATIPEKPGSFREFCAALGPRSITEFNYRYRDTQQAKVFAGIRITNAKNERDELLGSLKEKGYQPVDMTDNELAKIHIRFMVGGSAGERSIEESLFRIEFPERPGALVEFLSQLSSDWNITLFHYRNHGAAYGRVLMGIQLLVEEKQKFVNLMKMNDFVFFEETDNDAYSIFLK